MLTTLQRGSGLSRRGRVHKAKKTMEPFKDLESRWFTMNELAASGQNGCGSCRMLERVFKNVFADERNAVVDEGQLVYSISPQFLCRVRSSSSPETRGAKVALFQPLGKYT